MYDKEINVGNTSAMRYIVSSKKTFFFKSRKTEGLTFWIRNFFGSQRVVKDYAHVSPESPKEHVITYLWNTVHT